MNNQPFFSIVIPTRGRPTLLADAIRSVLTQDFSDFELIVSDNFNDDRTKQTINSFLDHPKIKYFRTESELSMPQHWEFATRKATGKYVLILTDRSVFAQHTLSTLHKNLLANPEIAVCSWRCSCYDEQQGIIFGNIPDSPFMDNELLSTILVANDFAKKSIRGKYHYALPRGLNSLYRSDLAEHIRKKHGALFLPMSPDYTSAFLLLSYTNSTLFINKPLFISQGISLSNGGNALFSMESVMRYLQTLGVSDFYPLVPIEAPITESLLFSDFLMIKKNTNGYLNDVEIDWVEYFVGCYSEILLKEKAGIMSKNEVKHLNDVWKIALDSFNKDTQRSVNLRVKKIKLRMFLKQSPIGPFLVNLKRRVESLKLPDSQQKRYNSVMEAAGFHNTHTQ